MTRKISITLLGVVVVATIALFVVTDVLAQASPPPGTCTVTVPGKNKKSPPTVVQFTATAQNVLEDPCPVVGYATCYRSEWTFDTSVSVLYLGLPTQFVDNFNIIGIGLPETPQGFVPPKDPCSADSEVYPYDCNTAELEINFQSFDRFNLYFVPEVEGTMPRSVSGNIVAKVDGKLGACGPDGIAVPTIADECEPPPPDVPTINDVLAVYNLCDGDLCCTVEVNEADPVTSRVLEGSCTFNGLVPAPSYGPGKTIKGGTPRKWKKRVESPGQWCYNLTNGEEVCFIF